MDLQTLEYSLTGVATVATLGEGLVALKGAQTLAQQASKQGAKTTIKSLWDDVAGWFGKGAKPKSTIQANKAKGEAFERDSFNKLEKELDDFNLTDQITLKTKSGTRTRIDIGGKDSKGNCLLVECKSSATAPLTKNQKKAFPEIEKTGATVVGNIVVPYVDDRVMPRDKFYYQFKTLVYNRRAYTIDAVSLSSGGESSMVDADDVDYHRIQRYGGLILGALASAGSATFLDSQAERDLQAQAEIVDSVVASSPTLGQNTRELTKENLKVATNYLSQLGVEQFSRRPTIYEGAGPQLIIFRQEQTDEGLPAVFVGLD